MKFQFSSLGLVDFPIRHMDNFILCLCSRQGKCCGEVLWQNVVGKSNNHIKIENCNIDTVIRRVLTY